MTKNYFVSSRNVLGVCTNVPVFKWSFGINNPLATKEEFDSCIVRFNLNVVPTIADFPQSVVGNNDIMGKYHYFSGNAGEDRIFYQRTFMFGSKIQYELKDLLTDNPTMTVNDTYFKHIHVRFMNLHSVGYILTDLAGLLMLHRGYAPLHCSGFRKDDATVVIFAPPNTGKTLSAMMSCIEYGADFIAEDLAISDGRNIYSVPGTSTFRYYDRVEQSKWSKIVNSVTKFVPPVELLGLAKNKPIEDFVDGKKIVHKSPITHVVILERGNKESVENVGTEECIRKVLNLNRYEFNYHKAPAAVVHEFFNPALDLLGACQAELDITRKLVENATKRTVVTVKDATRYALLLIENL